MTSAFKPGSSFCPFAPVESFFVAKVSIGERGLCGDIDRVVPPRTTACPWPWTFHTYAVCISQFASTPSRSVTRTWTQALGQAGPSATAASSISWSGSAGTRTRLAGWSTGREQRPQRQSAEFSHDLLATGILPPVWVLIFVLQWQAAAGSLDQSCKYFKVQSLFQITVLQCVYGRYSYNPSIITTYLSRWNRHTELPDGLTSYMIPPLRRWQSFSANFLGVWNAYICSTPAPRVSE